MYLKRQLHLHLVRKHLGDHTIKRRQNLHSELRFDPAFVNQVIERIGERQTDTVITTQKKSISGQPHMFNNPVSGNPAI